MAKDEDELKLTYRIWTPYAERIVERARAARLKPNQFARIATMAAVDEDLLSVNERLTRIEETLRRLRKDFKDAVE